jgi:twitching motility protein PilT
MELIKLLSGVIERDATDLHITVNSPPVIRIHGQLTQVEEKVLTKEDTEDILSSILTERQKSVFERDQAIDLAYNLNGNNHACRFRVNIYRQKGCMAGAFRRLADHIPSLEELNLPVSLYNLCTVQDGLILVTGPTGSGKTSTLASLIESINQTTASHIITIEDPVEYLFNHHKSLINQRELHTDVPSFADGLRSALREDPDVILVGEMRDLETIRTAIMAAETGHLVLATLHTRDATSTISRIVGVYPADEQEQIAHQLSLALKAVVSQKLLRQKDGKGRVPAIEVMRVTPGIANMIRQHKSEQIRSVIETGATQGMQSMEYSLSKLFREGKIDRDTALKNARDVSYIERLMKQP